MIDKSKILLIGIGNSGRGDDALGWLFLDEVKKRYGNKFDYEYRYQLQIEDAELIAHYHTVYFVDASIDIKDNPYGIKPVKPVEIHHFTSHELPPETILYLCQTVYNQKPAVKLIGIFGKNFELKIGLSKEAKVNLNKCIEAFFEMVKVAV